MKRTFEFFSDPAHGWLRVELSELVRLGIQMKISRCSYIRGDYAYLEEDVDMMVFMAALEDADGTTVKDISLVEYAENGLSRIRDFRPYSCTFFSPACFEAPKTLRV